MGMHQMWEQVPKLSNHCPGRFSMCARAFMRTLAELGELWRNHHVAYSREPELQRRSLAFTRVPLKMPSACGWPSECEQIEVEEQEEPLPDASEAAFYDLGKL